MVRAMIIYQDIPRYIPRDIPRTATARGRAFSLFSYDQEVLGLGTLRSLNFPTDS